MELVQYIRLLRRWWWLILLFAFVAGSVGFIFRSNQPPVYSAETKIAIGGWLTVANPDTGQIRAAVDLTLTYAELATTFGVLDATVQALSLPISPDNLGRRVTISTIANTSLLAIRVEYGDPVLVADIANELATQLIQQSPSNLTPDQQIQMDIANEQIRDLTADLRLWRAELETVKAALTTTSTDAEIQRLIERRNVLEAQINEGASNIAAFTNTVTNLQQRTNSLTVVEAARIPSVPIGTSAANSVLVFAATGAAVAFGIVLLLEYMNDTIRWTDEVTQRLNLPVLGVISQAGNADAAYSSKLISNNLFSHTMEEFNTLRINLMFNQGSDPVKTIILTSPAPVEGKSLTASNLAISIALSEKRVLLIDCDLRRPRLHEIFGMQNVVGLSTILSGSNGRPARSANGGKPSTVESASLNDINWKEFLQNPGISNLSLLTSGYMPANPSEMLGSLLFKRWLEVFRDSGLFDVIIIDTPPCLVVSDSVVVAAAAERSDILLLIRAGRTKTGAAVRSVERFTSVHLPIAGIILNGVNRADESYYGYYDYSYYYKAEKKA